MTDFTKYIKKAERLVAKLKEKCSSETICENYGQREIRKFIDKMNAEINDLDYQEVCSIKDILYQVSSITNNK